MQLKTPEHQIKKIIFENLDKDKFDVFLFGSRVVGNYRKNSDYDIGIKGEKKMDFRKYIQLKRKLDDNINFPVDLVDFNRVDEEFSKIALKNIKIWNKSKNTKILEKIG